MPADAVDVRWCFTPWCLTRCSSRSHFKVVPFTESRVKRAHEYATALQQHRQRSADKQHAAQERQRVRAKSAAPFGRSSSSSTPFSEYQSVYQDWSPYLTRPAPRYHTGATHYYNSGIQQAQTRMDTVRVEDTAGSRTRKVTTAHSGNVHGPTVAQTTADWTRLQRTVKAAGRPTSSIAVATPYTQAAEEAATQYNPSRYQRAETATAEVKKGSGYHDEGYKSFATTSTSMRSPVATSFTTSAATSPQHEASQQTEPQRVEVMVEPRQTTYDLARALLERAKSRRALHV